jgi:hypothetical protein
VTVPVRDWTVDADVFRTKRDQTLDYVRTSQDEWRSHATGTGDNAMDVFQLLLMQAGHTERHVAQINEVKSDPKFPK